MKRFLKWISLGIVLLTLLVIVAGLLAPDENPAVPYPESGSYLSIDNLNIRYRQLGQGPDVLLIHGLPGSIEDFDALMATLAKRYRVTAYDRPAQGYSSAVGARYTLVHNAHVARQLIRKLDLQEVIVVGHSYGGSTALQLAIEQTPGVRGYIALAPGADPYVNLDPFFGVVTTPVIGKGILAVSGWLGNTISKAKIKSGLEDACYPNNALCSDAFITLRQQIWMQPTVSLAIAHEMITMYPELAAMQAKYATITAPVMLVQGDGDRTVPVAESEYLLQSIPTAQRVLLKDTGHYSPIVRVDEVVKVIDEMASLQPGQGVATLSRFEELSSSQQ